jgi:polygalacturonase
MMMAALLLPALAQSMVLDIRDFGAVADSLLHNETNAVAITNCLTNATAGDTVLVPGGQTFHAIGGISAVGLNGVTIRIEGNLSAVPDFSHWPCPDGHKFLDFLSCSNCSAVKVTGEGTIDGQGLPWWNKWVEGGIKGHSRPHLVVFETSTDLLIEKITMVNSPNFHVRLGNVARVEVRFVRIEVNRKEIRQVKKEEAGSSPSKYSRAFEQRTAADIFG